MATARVRNAASQEDSMGSEELTFRRLRSRLLVATQVNTWSCTVAVSWRTGQTTKRLRPRRSIRWVMFPSTLPELRRRRRFTTCPRQKR